MQRLLAGRSGLDSIQVVSHGSVGANFIDSLARLTGAGVAASDDLTSLGGGIVTTDFSNGKILVAGI